MAAPSDEPDPREQPDEPETTDQPSSKSHADQAPSGTPLVVLPFGPWMPSLLTLLRRGLRLIDRGFTQPVFRVGLGPLLSSPLAGSMLVLRTTGRKTGLLRETPLGYAIVDGQVVVAAGYGRDCHWFRNALANPQVEIALPGALLAGYAEEITDPEQRRRAFRTTIASMGVLGRAALGEVEVADDARIDELIAEIPLLAITPTAVLPGPYDPDGSFWRLPLGATILGAALVGGLWRRTHRSCRHR
jgi:deazaflavin-dependent oxidoreductase (nitroreductase family)